MILRALVGFVLGLTPLSVDLMGWRGAGGSGAANTGNPYAVKDFYLFSFIRGSEIDLI